MRTNFPRALSDGLALSLALATLALVFALALATTRASAQGRESQQPGAGDAAPGEKPKPPANSVVYGRAVFAESSRAVRRARVRLMRADAVAGGRGRAGLTDANGRFRIENVEAVCAVAGESDFSFVFDCARACDALMSVHERKRQSASA